MKIAVFQNNSSIAGRPVFQAFVDSLIKDGQEVVDNDMGADVAVIWSLLWNGRMKPNKAVWDHYHSKNKPVIVLEVGCIKRNETWKVGIDGINNVATWPECDGPRRLGLSAKPWYDSRPTDHIIVCGQHGYSEQWHGMPPVDEWMLNVSRSIRAHTNRKIILRPHPRFTVKPNYAKEFSNMIIASPRHVNGSYDDYDFESYLHDAHAVVCYSSNPGVVAVMNGIPAFVSQDSLAHPVAMDMSELSQIENPRKPDREDWLNTLSYTEWTVGEIANGEPWCRLKDKLCTD